MRRQFQLSLYLFARRLSIFWQSVLIDLEIWAAGIERKFAIQKKIERVIMGRRKKMVEVEEEFVDGEEELTEDGMPDPLHEAAVSLENAWADACQDVSLLQKHRLKQAICLIVSLAKKG